MNKEELVSLVAKRSGQTEKDTAVTLNATMEEIMVAVAAGETVAFSRFGVFESRNRARRAARNPRTGESIPVPPRTVPVFRPAAGFIDRVVAAAKARLAGASRSE